jgi:uncharacterized protein (TIGR02246 family)
MDVQSVIDREAIRELGVTYARAVDRHDIELLKGCFTKDGRMSLPGTFDFRGRDAIGEGIASTRRYSATTHLIGNQTVSLGRDRADAESYCIAYHLYPKGGDQEVYVAAIRYLDTVVRDDGEWRIAERELAIDWSVGVPLPLPPLTAPNRV